MSVKVISVFSVNEDDPQALAEYLEAAQRLVDRAGGRVVTRFSIRTVHGEGEGHPPPSVLVLEFPDRGRVEAMLSSDGRKALRPLRERAFHDYRLSVTSNVA
ncbi:DUF1330 domain-containing protein [Roseivivax sediminis]|uniref:Uncharacterized conserved protein, DUF1330 family n=1 Tax=Roseivivax sediminis TaxID=936889 RepID=A0A1I1SW38_9RHOB|nr:DUF1330 domain-containing protein [Roseivivax sediminis]SFD48103.1 Uncharacterized conserved protein, DUF1330 family [Roseivivax sediminis]